MDALLDEGCTIQHRLVSHSGFQSRLDDDHHISRCFVEHMLHGNVKTALNLLNTSEHSGVSLSLDRPISPGDPSWLVIDELKKKHPVGWPAPSEVLLPPLTHDSVCHPIVCDVLVGAN